MIRPERDPHWCLGVEHGRDGLEPYDFQDAENQRRYLDGYERGRMQRAALLAAHPYQQPGAGLGFDLHRVQQRGPLYPGAKWKV